MARMANCIAKIAMQNAHAGRLAEVDKDLAETGDSVVATAADTAQAIGTKQPQYRPVRRVGTGFQPLDKPLIDIIKEKS